MVGRNGPVGTPADPPVGSADGPVPTPQAQHQEGWSSVYVGKRHVEVLTMGSGVPVVFLHGWGLSPRSYRGALGALAAQGFQVFAPSLPGFGHSSPVPHRNQNVSGVADHMALVIEELGFESPVAIIGHSFGGGVALRLGATRPDLVRSLTLVCPVGGAGAGAVPLPRMVTGLLSESFSMWAGHAVTEVAAALMRHPASVLTTAFAAWRSDQLLDLSDIQTHHIPTRFLFADRDTVVSPGGIPERVFEQITCDVITGHHSWLISNPDVFAAHAAEHLKKPPVPRPPP